MVQVELIPQELPDEYEVKIEVTVKERYVWNSAEDRKIEIAGSLRTLGAMVAGGGLGQTVQGMIEDAMNTKIAQVLCEIAEGVTEDGEETEA